MTAWSSMALLILRTLTTFGCQLIHQRYPRLHVTRGAMLCPFYEALLRSDSHFVVFDSEDDFISSVDAESLTVCSRNYYAAILVYAYSDVVRHGKILIQLKTADPSRLKALRMTK